MANNYDQATVSPYLPASLFSEAELEWLSCPCGLSADRCGDELYFYAEEGFREEEEDADGNEINVLSLFQEKLRQLDPVQYPSIVIHGAATCGKMRQDEFGGFAHFITRDAIRSFSTWQWLHEQAQQIASPPAPASAEQRPYSVLLLYPDYACETFGQDTYYAFVEARDQIEAVEIAQRQAVAAQDTEIDDPADFAPLLVTQGHHASEPLFNK
jgi:hypothetical protein